MYQYIAFSYYLLLKYTDYAPTPYEIAESVDMMRILEHGLKVRMVPTVFDTHDVDTEDDLHFVEKIMKKNFSNG